jgi:hypothetical protein
MTTDFIVKGLPSESFAHLVDLSNAQLAERGVHVSVSDSVPGYPCRVSLADVPVGEDVLLINYEHLPAATPFRSNGPIFVKRNASSTQPSPNEIPEVLRGRPLSVRGYDKGGMMWDADLVQGHCVESLIERLFENPEIDFLHVHFAKRGCYACAVERA